ncbi:MAG: hypothetical protein WA691_00340 [Thermoplasmata archaeon]
MDAQSERARLHVRDTCPFRIAPERDDDEIVAAKKGLGELLGLAEGADEHSGENERLRNEKAERHRYCPARENPNVPHKMRNDAPGYFQDRLLTPAEGWR